MSDSAGIEIVVNDRPAWEEGAGWAVGESPTVDIGGVGRGVEYELNRVVGAVRLSDGRIALANADPGEVRFYDASGVYIGTSGRKGSGPGEFQMIGGMWAGRGDSLLIADIVVQRLTMLDGQGDLGRVFSLGGRSGVQVGQGSVSLALPNGWLDDGSVIGVEMGIRLTRQEGASYRDTTAVIRFGSDGARRDTVLRAPGIEMLQTRLSLGGQAVPIPTPVPLGRQTIIATRGDRVFIAVNDAWEIEERTPEGQLVRIIRVNGSPPELTPEDVAAHRREQRELMEGLPQMRAAPPALLQQILDRIETVDYPERFTYVGAMLGGPDKTLWVGEVASPLQLRAPFAIFDSAGILLGRVRMPERFQPTAILATELIGIWKDSDGVEHVRAYPLSR